jgi:hypothetical protein
MVHLEPTVTWLGRQQALSDPCPRQQHGREGCVSAILKRDRRRAARSLTDATWRDLATMQTAQTILAVSKSLCMHA